jgi:polysaccharide biosynthesis protein PslA
MWGCVVTHDESSLHGRGRNVLNDELVWGSSSKRLFDISAAVLCLLLLSPLILIVAIAIKLDSYGPIFARETVYGYRKRPIPTFKFRFKTDDANPRLTRVGRVLLRSGIDELPKLFSVLYGDMSIVGPRPYTQLEQVIGYRAVAALYDLKPGLIRWTEVTGSGKSLGTTAQRIDDDLRYAVNWTLFLDIRIILASLFW